MELVKKLSKIQRELKAPKNQYNAFAKFNYRSCEDIVEAIKPLLDGAILILTDEVVNVGNHNYIKASAIIKDEKDEICAVGYAREAEMQKGMNDAQLTGSSSSYARKYALNGLFAIDDTKDADTRDNSVKNEQKSDAKGLLRSKVANYLKEQNLEPTSENTIKAIQDKSGIKIKDMKDIDETNAKMIIGLW